MLAWPLYGAGMENFGVDDKPVLVDVPKTGDDELLVRIDAVGLCFSDVKLIKTGENHPRVVSKDLKKHPVIPGHEAVMTVVKVGSKLKDRFKLGQRFIIQADIFYQGKALAYGYALDGGFAQYSRIDKTVFDGDECCYLLPIAESTPAAIAAMIEPWTCVIASYMIEKRTAPLKGGRILLAGEKDDAKVYEPGKLVKNALPSEIIVFGLGDGNLAAIREQLPGAKIVRLDNQPQDGAFDDIFICNMRGRAMAEKIAALGSKNAVVSFIGRYPAEKWGFDVGAIHYKGWFYQGADSLNLSDAYGRNVRAALKKGGACWLVGGAGAMGQMHTQLAVESPDGPSRILVTDMDDVRLRSLCGRLEEKAKSRGIEFKALNPKNFKSPSEFEAEVAKFAAANGGFDDIVMLVPVVAVLNSSVRFLKKDGLMNIFAGIPAGTSGLLDIKEISENGVRYIGASGSLTAHLRHTLELTERRKIDPSTALAAIGGMRELKKGLEAVANAKFPGKTVIFPNIESMPLTALTDIGTLAPGLEKTLSSEGLYTMETEKALLKSKG